MFNIDDALLTKIGYNVAMLTEEQKDKYKREIQEELNRRVAERFLPKLSDDEIIEFEDVQGNPDRTRRWLAMSFYAAALWLRYAIPGYGKMMQEVFDEYVEELIDMRNEVNKQLGLIA